MVIHYYHIISRYQLYGTMVGWLTMLLLSSLCKLALSLVSIPSYIHTIIHDMHVFGYHSDNEPIEILVVDIPSLSSSVITMMNYTYNSSLLAATMPLSITSSYAWRIQVTFNAPPLPSSSSLAATGVDASYSIASVGCVRFIQLTNITARVVCFTVYVRACAVLISCYMIWMWCMMQQQTDDWTDDRDYKQGDVIHVEWVVGAVEGIASSIITARYFTHPCVLSVHYASCHMQIASLHMKICNWWIGCRYGFMIQPLNRWSSRK